MVRVVVVGVVRVELSLRFEVAVSTAAVVRGCFRVAGGRCLPLRCAVREVVVGGGLEKGGRGSKFFFVSNDDESSLARRRRLSTPNGAMLLRRVRRLSFRSILLEMISTASLMSPRSPDEDGKAARAPSK